MFPKTAALRTLTASAAGLALGATIIAVLYWVGASKPSFVSIAIGAAVGSATASAPVFAYHATRCWIAAGDPTK